MKCFVLSILFLVFTSCVVQKYVPPPPVTVMQPNTIKWIPLVRGGTISYNEGYFKHPNEMYLNNGMILSKNGWTILKEVIEPFSTKSSEVIINAFLRYSFGYDKVDKVIKFRPLQDFSSPYLEKSFILLKGFIENNKVSGSIMFNHHGKSWLFAKTIKIVADDFTWESPELNFMRENGSDYIVEYTFMDLEDKDSRILLDNIIKSKETIIRFRGDQYYSDFIVSDRMKSDIKIMLKAIDIINE
ncbi:MAG: hypothetical protein PF638_12025 [Candidatus Delongbacteria bacterium]|jgi:hypothetical protein|nr:hypothetical protein [Candidatus Delongbacteria bacterium]